MFSWTILDHTSLHPGLFSPTQITFSAIARNGPPYARYRYGSAYENCYLSSKFNDIVVQYRREEDSIIIKQMYLLWYSMMRTLQ